MTDPATVHQLEIEPFGHTQLDYGRGREGEYHRITIEKERPHGTLCDSLGP